MSSKARSNRPTFFTRLPAKLLEKKLKEWSCRYLKQVFRISAMTRGWKKSLTKVAIRQKLHETTPISRILMTTPDKDSKEAPGEARRLNRRLYR